MCTKRHDGKTKKISFRLLLLFPLLFLCGCSDTAEEINFLAPAALIYMIADNNLDYYAVQNIKLMERGLPDDGAGPVFVF